MLFYEAVDGGLSGDHTPSKMSELPSPVLPATGDEGLKQLEVHNRKHFTTGHYSVVAAALAFYPILGLEILERETIDMNSISFGLVTSV